MSKSKIILAAVGGVSALLAVAAAVAVWFAYSGKVAALEGDEDEGVDGLETVRSQVTRFTSGKIYPCQESVKALKANAERLADWRTESVRFAARGDRFFEKTTPAAFKAKIVRDSKTIASMKGAENGLLVKPDFTFGPFKPYISEGKMPEEAKLPELQRRWDDVFGLAETFAACGVDEFASIAFRDGDSAAEKKAEAEKKNSAANKRGKKRQEPAKSVFKPSSFSYTAVFRARPNSIIKVVNAFATCERFVVIDSFSFERERDTLAVALGGVDKKKQETQQTQSRRRRRRGAAEQQQAEEPSAADAAAASGIVTDPLLDGPFLATLSFTVYDFNSLAEEKKEEGKGESK